MSDSADASSIDLRARVVTYTSRRAGRA